MTDALKVSSDVYFYNLGLHARSSGNGGQIQDWARQYGLGQRTGIDLPSEVSGLIPDPAWRNRLYHEHLTDRPWSVGDNVNLAVGQGDLEADPLQMAVAYAALGNGGTIVSPAPRRRRRERHRPACWRRSAPRRAGTSTSRPTTRDTIMTGLTRAATEPGGTSYPVFGNFPFAVAGKTGTAQRPTSRTSPGTSSSRPPRTRRSWSR